MKNVLKRSLSLVLAISTIFGSAYAGLNELALNSFFAVETKAANVDALTFKLNDDGESYSVTDCDTAVEGDLVIPDTYNGLRVTDICYSAFEYCDNLTSITIPYGVTGIDESTFSYCKSLKSITIPNSVEYIGVSAFHSCTSLTSITIPESLTIIDLSAFACCTNLTSIIIPGSVTYIGEGAFRACDNLAYVFYTGTEVDRNNIIIETRNSDLEESIWHYKTTVHTYSDWVIDLKATCTEDGEKSRVCSECQHKEVVVIPAFGHKYSDELTVEIKPTCSENGSKTRNCSVCGYTQKTILAATGHTIVNNFCTQCRAVNDFEYSVKDGEATITEYLGTGTDVVIPSSIEGSPVTKIGYWAFYGNEYIKSVIIPDSVKAIDDEAFSFCENLSSITIGENVTSIGYQAFGDTAYYFDDENWEDGFLYIGKYLIGSDPESVGACAFIRNGTEIIADFSVEQCYELEEITIPDTVTHIGIEAFCYCEILSEINLSNNLINIGDNAFADCCISSIVIPDSVKTIGMGAFSGCRNLESIVIPEGVMRIDDGAFAYCYNLADITLPNKEISIGNNAFIDTTYFDDEDNWNNGILYIGNHLIKGYETVSGSLTVKKGTLTIADSAFKNCNGLKVVKIPDSVKLIGDKAIGYYYDEDLHETCKIDDFVIVAEQGTAAQAYAEENDFIFIDKNHTHKKSSWIIDTETTVYKSGSKHKECTECGEILETAEIKQLKASKPKLKSISNTSSGVKITWGKVKGADTYRVYRKTKGGEWKYLGSTSKTGYTDKTAKSGTKYYYAVRARNEAGNSSLSSTLSKYYLSDPTLKTPKSTKSGISLKWTKVTGAQGYIIYRKTADGSYKKLKTEKGVSNLSYIDKSAKKGKKYTYKVKAYYSKTYSAYSNTKTITDKY